MLKTRQSELTIGCLFHNFALIVDIGGLWVVHDHICISGVGETWDLVNAYYFKAPCTNYAREHAGACSDEKDTIMITFNTAKCVLLWYR